MAAVENTAVAKQKQNTADASDAKFLDTSMTSTISDKKKKEFPV